MDKEQHWSKMADDFNKRVSYVAGRENIEIIQRELKENSEADIILELGCGNGMYTGILAANCKKLYVTDYSEQMVAVCRENFKELPNAIFQQQNCCELEYEDRSFNCVVMINLLHIIEDPEKSLQESWRVLKPGGKIIVSSFTMSGMNLISKLRMIYRYLRVFGKPPAKSRTLTLDMTTGFFENAGFCVADLRLIGKSSKAVFAVGLKK